MYKTLFCLFILFVVHVNASAQKVQGQLVWTTNEVNKSVTFKNQPINNLFSQELPNLFLIRETYWKKIQPQFITAQATQRSFFCFSPESFSSDFYNYKLGWACKQEWKLEKATSIPIKLRLGSIEQVDFLEGKKTAP